jgi:hypothetical protein
MDDPARPFLLLIGSLPRFALACFRDQPGRIT